MFFKYLFYIIRHKWYVMIECFKRGLIWRGLLHDLSKLLPDEFFPYMNWFYNKYGVNIENKQKIDNKDVRKHKKFFDNFNKAWLKHQHRNKHHYQYWNLLYDDGTEKQLKIPDKYKIEMLCDWIGAGKAIIGKNNIKDWWNKTKDKKKINKKVFKWLEREINENT